MESFLELTLIVSGIIGFVNKLDRSRPEEDLWDVAWVSLSVNPRLRISRKRLGRLERLMSGIVTDWN